MNLSASLGPVEIDSVARPELEGKSMQHGVTGLIFGVVCLVIGAGLLYDGASGRDPLQVGTIGGAALLSLGVVTLGIILKERLKWKRELRKYREE